MKYGKLCSCLLAAGCAFGAWAAEIKSGDSIAFLGDSITQFGWQQPSGYVRMAEAAFRANGLDVKIIPAGISGHKSNQMLERLDRDVISKKPTYMTLSCGVNDVWHGRNGVVLEDYKKNITEIVNRAQAAGIKVIILTATMIREDVDNQENQKLAAYNDFLRELAREKGCVLADLSAEMIRQVGELRAKTGKKHNFLTNDGVHMDYAGNLMMAEGVLKALGFTPEELTRAEASFGKLGHDLRINGRIPVEEYLKLKAKADAQNQTVNEHVMAEIRKLAK